MLILVGADPRACPGVLIVREVVARPLAATLPWAKAGTDMAKVVAARRKNRVPDMNGRGGWSEKEGRSNGGIAGRRCTVEDFPFVTAWKVSGLATSLNHDRPPGPLPEEGVLTNS